MPGYEYGFPTRQLVNQQDAAMIENARVPRSRFQGRWTRKTAFDAGLLVPFMVDEILPGDHMHYDVTAYVRMSTPIFPLFDNQRIDTFFFFIPCRLVWINWARFMGEQDAPGDSIVFPIPQTTSPVGGYLEGSLADHFGIPIRVPAGTTMSVNALPFRAYNLIWNKWFRDENIWGKLVENTGAGPDAAADYAVVYRAKPHDYFTSALPWPQKFTAPTVPLAGQAPVMGLGILSSYAPPALVGVYRQYDSSLIGSTNIALTGATTTNMGVATNSGGPNATPLIYADLASSTGVAINVLRNAWLVQELLERDARGGTRYVELIRSHFGVTNPDFRLQRPEYIGGGQTPLQITPIAQTAPSAGVPLGALGGAGTSAGRHQASYAATEHGYIIAMINVRSELSYQQGLHKMWTRLTRYDFYWPSLAGLGEQAVLNGELYFQGNANDALVFGYQERWQEYRTRMSEVTAVMRSTATGTIDAWHLAQKFTTLPTLSSTFLADIPPMARVLAAGALAAGQQYLADIEIHRTATRPLPMFGTPATLARF